jgi:hypothetical protein
VAAGDNLRIPVFGWVGACDRTCVCHWVGLWPGSSVCLVFTVWSNIDWQNLKGQQCQQQRLYSEPLQFSFRVSVGQVVFLKRSRYWNLCISCSANHKDTTRGVQISKFLFL